MVFPDPTSPRRETSLFNSPGLKDPVFFAFVQSVAAAQRDKDGFIMYS